MWTGDNNSPEGRKLPGLYAAQVKAGDEVEAFGDGAFLGRILVSVPAVLDEEGVAHQVWARPCFPPGHFYYPQAGDCVWVAFEGGDPAAPVWLGVFYTRERPPGQAASAPRKITITAAEITLQAGGIKLGADDGRDPVVRLSQMKEQFNKLVADYNKHVHTVTTCTGDVTATKLVPTTEPLTDAAGSATVGVKS